MKYFRVATINTTEVSFDLPNGFIGISGISTTLNSVEFYKSFLNELIAYRDVEGDIHLEMSLEYFNTSSAKCFYDILRELKKRNDKSQNITVNWFYDHQDDDMLEMGRDFSALIEIDFKFLPVGIVTF